MYVYFLCGFLCFSVIDVVAGTQANGVSSESEARKKNRYLSGDVE